MHRFYRTAKHAAGNIRNRPGFPYLSRLDFPEKDDILPAEKFKIQELL